MFCILMVAVAGLAIMVTFLFFGIKYTGRISNKIDKYLDYLANED